jgi:choice-of-anchor B domain-containing protein
MIIRLICTPLFAVFFVLLHAQDAYRYKQLGQWNDTQLPMLNSPEGQRWNELTGWVDTTSGKEYVIMGSIDSVYFFDVSDPAQIKKCDVRSGLNRVVNRDVEVYGHYAYCVSDNGPSGKMQVYDLSYLPDSVSLVFESDTFGHNVHSMFVNPESKRLYLCSVKKSPINIPMMVLSIDTPEKPSLLGLLGIIPSGCERVHEVYIRRDTAFCSCEYKGLFVYDLRNMQNQILLGAITPPYPYNGYNHTSWPDSALQHIAFTDELPNGQPLKVYRIRGFDDMTYLTHFNTNNGATPHNLFWVGNLLHVSWYHDGIYTWDMSNPRKPKVHAYFDTYHQNATGDYSGFKGCWGVYPFFPSGNIAASDMTNGLFMIRYDQSVGLNNQENDFENPVAYPNPSNDLLMLDLNVIESGNYSIQCFDLQGKRMFIQLGNIADGSNGIIIEKFLELDSGIYALTIETDMGYKHTIKILKQ